MAVPTKEKLNNSYLNISGEADPKARDWAFVRDDGRVFDLIDGSLDFLNNFERILLLSMLMFLFLLLLLLILSLRSLGSLLLFMTIMHAVNICI